MRSSTSSPPPPDLIKDFAIAWDRCRSALSQRTQSISGLRHPPLSIINFLLGRATFLSIKNRLPAEITYPGTAHEFPFPVLWIAWLQQSSSSCILLNWLHPCDTGNRNCITRQELQPPPPCSCLPWPPHVHTRLSYCTEIPMDRSKWKLYIFLCHTGPGADFLLCTTWAEQQGQSSFKKPSLFFYSVHSQDKTEACFKQDRPITIRVMP